MDGYNKVGNTCTLIDANLNCLRMENNNCTICKEGYYLENGACYEP